MWLATLGIFSLIMVTCHSNFNTGFWYDGYSRAPVTNYPVFDNLPYANMTVKINRPFQDGPGQNLIKDPMIPEKILYVGNTINRQTFDTQFILDLQFAIGVDAHRIFVVHVSQGRVHFSWESSSVIVQFIILETNQTTVGPTLLEALATLTSQIQNTTSPLYVGTNVTCDTDPLWGLQVETWDVSLQLSYAIQTVGGPAVEDGYYLNQGGSGLCDYFRSNSSLYLINKYKQYCEFERFFEDDISRALSISYHRVQILFVKQAAMDAVLVHFRVDPPREGSGEVTVVGAIADLTMQVYDYSSKLYAGNVTIRVDPTWGVSGNLPAKRSRAPLFNRKYYEYDPSRLDSAVRMTQITAYDRCKANRRCNWGIAGERRILFLLAFKIIMQLA